MRVAVACDHAGFPLKHPVIELIRRAGHSTTGEALPERRNPEPSLVL